MVRGAVETLSAPKYSTEIQHRNRAFHLNDSSPSVKISTSSMAPAVPGFILAHSAMTQFVKETTIFHRLNGLWTHHVSSEPSLAHLPAFRS